MLRRLIGTAKRAMSSGGGRTTGRPGPAGGGTSRRGGSSMAGGLMGAVKGFMRGRRRGGTM